MGKGEIARNEQFLLFQQFFPLIQIIVSPLIHVFAIIFLFAAELEKPKIGLSGKGLTLSQTSPGFHVSAVQSFENTKGKGGIARIECFPPI